MAWPRGLREQGRWLGEAEIACMAQESNGGGGEAGKWSDLRFLPGPLSPPQSHRHLSKSLRRQDSQTQDHSNYGFRIHGEFKGRGDLSYLPGADGGSHECRLWSQLLSSLHHAEL